MLLITQVCYSVRCRKNVLTILGFRRSFITDCKILWIYPFFPVFKFPQFFISLPSGCTLIVRLCIFEYGLIALTQFQLVLIRESEFVR